MRKPVLFVLLALLAVFAVACGQQAATPPPAPTSAPAAAPKATEAPKAAAAAPTTAPTTAPAAAPKATEVPKAAAPTAAAAAPAVKAPATNTVRINLTGFPDNLDPQQASFVNEIGTLSMLYEGLVILDKDLKAVGGAAESWTASEDGKTYTFKLRSGLKWSDGQPLTAKHYEFAWKRAADPAVQGEYAAETFLIEGAEEYNSADTKALNADQLKALRDKVGVRAVDDTTLEFKLVKPAAYWPYIATLWIGWPVREDVLAKCGETWWLKAECHVGNGPFTLKELKEKEVARFVPNPNWRAAKPAADEVVHRYITDSKVAFEAYKNNELDIIALAAEDLKAVQSDTTLASQVARYPGGCTYAMQFNQSKPPFNNRDARFAAGKSVDREAWVRDVLQGIGKPATAWMAPGTPGYKADQGADLKFDPAAAKTAWQKAGSPPEIKLTYSSSPRNKVRFEFMADQLQKALGAKVTLDPVEPTTYTALTKDVTTSPEIFILGWCQDYPDPQNWLSLYWRSTSGFAKRTAYANPEFDKLVDQADVEKDAAKRLQLYQQAEALVLSDVGGAPLWNNENVYLVKPYVNTGTKTSMDSAFPGYVEPWLLGIKR